MIEDIIKSASIISIKSTIERVYIKIHRWLIFWDSIITPNIKKRSLPETLSCPSKKQLIRRMDYSVVITSFLSTR
jgi:hypothetical protein